MSEFIEYAGTGVAVLFLVYLVARLATAAYFRSKQTYESEKQNGKRIEPR